MFKISPIQDKEAQRRFAEECGCELRPEMFAYSMVDQESGATMGFSQFELCEGAGLIADLRPRIGYEDNEAIFILGRATMNFIDLMGLHICKCRKDAGDERILHAIGFKSERDGLLFCDMTGMFDGKCDGKET